MRLGKCWNSSFYNMIIEEMKEELGEEHSEVKNLVDELEFDSWKKEDYKCYW